MSGQPLFSVVVPTYNRCAQLESLLDSLAALHFRAQEWELIVVDDGGRVPLDSVMARYRERMRVTLLRQRNAGPAAARNLGAAHAVGEFLAFIDDDARPDPGWLHALAQAFEASPDALCGGRIVNGLAGNLYAEASQLLYDHLVRCYRPGEQLGAFFTTNGMAVSRARFQELGGLDGGMRFAEDRDFCYRWALNSRPFLLVPDAVVYHAHELDWKSFLCLHFCYGGGTWHFRQRCRAGGGPRVKVSPLGWYLDLVLSGWRQQPGLCGARLSALLAAAQSATAAGLLWRALGRNDLRGHGAKGGVHG
jgi:glycosyltransferase involved in cell wall biosynthesis